MKQQELSQFQEEKKPYREGLVQKISKIFLGESGLFRYDGFLRRQLIRSGLGKEQLQAVQSFIRGIESSQVDVSYETNPKSHKLEKVEKKYAVTTADLLKIVELAQKVENIKAFADLVTEVVNFDGVNSSTLFDLIDAYADIDSSQEILIRISQLEGVSKQQAHSIRRGDQGGLSVSEYRSGKTFESPELVTSFADSGMDVSEIFSETQLNKYTTVLNLLREKSNRYSDNLFSFSPTDIPVLFNIISDDTKYDVFLSYYQRIYDVSSYKISSELFAFEKMFELFPVITELHKTGFDISSYIGGIIGNYQFIDLFDKDLNETAFQEKISEMFSGVMGLEAILADSLFCANAKALSKSGIRVSPQHNSKYVNGEVIRDPEFYEVRPTGVVEKIGVFYKFGYKKLGMDLPSGSHSTGFLYVLDHLYSELAQTFADATTEDIQKRLALLPDNFYNIVYRREDISWGREESLFLLEKIFSFETPESFEAWLNNFTKEENIDAMYSQQWLQEYATEYAPYDYKVQQSILEFFFESGDVDIAVKRLLNAKENRSSVFDIINRLKEQNVKLSLKRVENIIRFTEYSDEQRSLFIKIYGERKNFSESQIYLYDSNVEMVDVVLRYSEEDIKRVTSLLERIGTEHFYFVNMLSPYETVNTNSVSFLFEKLTKIEEGYSLLEDLVPDVVSKYSISRISQYNFESFIKNITIFGENPGIVITLRQLKNQFGFRFSLETKGMGEALLVLFEKPSLISIADQLKEKANYFGFDPRDHESFSLLEDNPDLLKRIFTLSEDARYTFTGKDLGKLKDFFEGSNAERRMLFVSFLGKNFYGYSFSDSNIQFFTQIDNYEEVQVLCEQLSRSSYDFSAPDVVSLSEIAQNHELQQFVVEMTSKGVSFRSYELGSYQQLLRKKEEVITFLDQDPAHGKILSVNMKQFEESVPENLPAFLRMVVEIETSQSQDIRTLKNQLIDQLRGAQNPDAAWREIEAVFIKNHLPLVGKIFKIFEILYPSERVATVLEEHPATSPQLRNSGKQRRRFTIYRDLLYTHIKTGNRSLEQYLTTFSEGGSVCERFESAGFEALTEQEKYRLHEFLDRAQTLFVNSSLGLIGKKDIVSRSEEIEDPISEAGFADRLSQLKNAVGIEQSDSLYSRLNQMYARPLGKDSLVELLQEMQTARKEADSRGRKLYYDAVAMDRKLQLDAGNFLKAVNENFYHLIGQNGSVSQEFLGPSAGSDLTPLDTDLSIVAESHVLLEEGKKQEFKKILSASLSAPGTYGQLVFVMRDRGQFLRTSIEENPESLPQIGEKEYKPELFKTGVISDIHYGIRTGFPITDVDFMIFGDKMDKVQRSSVLLEIAKNGYYIPIVDEEGTILFTPDQFEDLRRVFSGISHISKEHVLIDMAEVNQSLGNLDLIIDDIVEQITEDRQNVEKQTKIIFDLVRETLQELGVSQFDPHSGSLLGARLDNTGSTSRGTNSVGDADFDMLLFLDALDFDKREEFKTALVEKLQPSSDASYSGIDFLQIRAKGITFPGLEGADIDLGLMPKSDERGFASHDAASAKLSDIKETYGQEIHDRVLANIVYAKNFLKGEEAYGAHIGCFFGIALENLILQNEGNIITAFRRFIEAAHRAHMSFDAFKKEFYVWNPGKGARAQSHENYIEEMTESGFLQTYKVMRRLLESSFGVQFEDVSSKG